MENNLEKFENVLTRVIILGMSDLRQNACKIYFTMNCLFKENNPLFTPLLNKFVNFYEIYSTS